MRTTARRALVGGGVVAGLGILGVVVAVAVLPPSCPAVHEQPTLVVRLADAWPDREDAGLRVSCGDDCAATVDRGHAAQGRGPGTSAGPSWQGTLFRETDEVRVEVLAAADDAVLAVRTVAPDWEPVGDAGRCGPTGASVVLEP